METFYLGDSKMLRFGSLLADTVPDTEKMVNIIHDKLVRLPDLSLYIMWILSIITAALVVVIFLRQRKIAKNQVELGQLIKQIIEKESS